MTELSNEERLRLITYREAARIIGVSHPTVGNLVEMGYLSPVKLPGLKRKRLRYGEVVEYLRDQAER